MASSVFRLRPGPIARTPRLTVSQTEAMPAALRLRRPLCGRSPTAAGSAPGTPGARSARTVVGRISSCCYGTLLRSFSSWRSDTAGSLRSDPGRAVRPGVDVEALLAGELVQGQPGRFRDLA